MIATFALIALSIAALYAIGQVNGATTALVPSITNGVKNVATVGAGYRPVEHIRG
ncbi:hypothetical protein K0651_02995 [Ornithinimicrobium sp. Arc0846-15]|nr:hypothetical protein [Ornithinimicrobium laminariae]